MTNQVTQCPNCKTSFRVTDNLLSVANGLVRCGSCLHIFNATEYWLDNTTPIAATSTQQTTINDDSEQANTTDIFDDDIFADDDFDLLAEKILAGADNDDHSPAQPPADSSQPDNSHAAEFESINDEPDEDVFLIEDDSDDAILADNLTDNEDDIFIIEEDGDDMMLVDDEDDVFIIEEDGDDVMLADDEDDVFIIEEDGNDVMLADDEDDVFIIEEESDDVMLVDDEDDVFIIEEESDDVMLVDDEDDVFIIEEDSDDMMLVDDEDDVFIIEEDGDEILFIDEDEQTIIIDENDDELIRDTSRHSIINTDEDLNAPKADSDGGEITTGRFSHSFLELDESSEDSASIFKELDNLNTEEEAVDEEAWAKKLLDEEDHDSTPLEQQQNKKTASKESAQKNQFQDIFDTLDDEASAEADSLNIADTPETVSSALEQTENTLDDDVFAFNDEPMSAGDRIGDNNNLLNNIEPEPVEMMAPADHKLWVKRSWQAACVLALVLFAGQYLFFNFDRFARDESYRPALAEICSLLGCQLPNLDDINQIRSSNLMVRSHAKADAALVVDAIIINKASFKQPFPIMELQFTDLSGKVISGRRFHPKEYLAGELAGNINMPSNRPIHISLEIVDPGKDAVNYQLQFHSSQI